MRSRFFSPALLCLFVLLSCGCATLPDTVFVSREKLQAALDRRFPYETHPAGVFVVKVGVPRLQLLPERNRLRVDLAIEAGDRIVRSSGHGALALSFALRYAPADATIRAADVRVEDMQLQGLPERWRAPAQVAGTLAVEHVLEGVALHAFRPDELARAQGRRPGAIRVTPAGLEIALVPAS